MQKLSAYNLAQNNNCGLITCSICGRSYRITEFGTDADCQSNSPSASVPNFCPYCASPFERPLTRVRNQEIEDYILDTIRIGMKSDTVLDPETVIDFLCNISDGGFELYDPSRQQCPKAYRWNRVYSAGQDARVHFEKAIRRDDQGRSEERSIPFSP